MSSEQRAVLSASAAVGATLRTLADQVEKLKLARAAADGDPVDEPEWVEDNDLAALAEFVTSGAGRPCAEAEARAAAARRRYAELDRQQVEHAVRTVLSGAHAPHVVVARLPERLRESAWEQIRARAKRTVTPKPPNDEVGVLHGAHARVKRAAAAE